MIDAKVKLHLAKLLGLDAYIAGHAAGHNVREWVQVRGMVEDFNPTNDAQFGQLVVWAIQHQHAIAGDEGSLLFYALRCTPREEHDNTPLGVKTAFCKALYRATGGE